MKAWITQLRKGLLEFCVLNALASTETYGYELVQRLRTIEELVISESTVYPILHRLRKDGYVKSKTVASSGGPPRRYFSLTALGKRHVGQMRNYWKDLGRSIEILMT